jgi:hypothetical protein
MLFMQIKDPKKAKQNNKMVIWPIYKILNHLNLTIKEDQKMCSLEGAGTIKGVFI